MSEHFPENHERGVIEKLIPGAIVICPRGSDLRVVQPPIVFVVFKYKSGEHPDILWELQGIFTTEEQAVEACREHRYGYWPEQLNRLLPPESEIPPGVIYPFGPAEGGSVPEGEA